MVALKRSPAILLFFFSAVFVFSQTEIHGSIGLNSGFIHTEGLLQTDALFTGSSASLRTEHSNAAVKAVLEGSINLSASPYLPSSFDHKFSIDKAYFKTRIPFIHDSFMRLSIGKMPISWGYGLVYNAGDILFTKNPAASPADTTGGDLSSLRSYADWAFHMYIPLSDFAVTEAAFLPPLEQTYTEPDITRSALRLQLLPYARFLETAEFGASVENNISEISFNALKLYAGIDGTLFADYNLCSSIEFSPGETKSFSFNEEAWAISAALFYSIGKTGLRTEVLYHPLSQSTDVFAMVNVTILDCITPQAVYNFSYKGKTNDDSYTAHTISAGLRWIPVKSVNISLMGSINIKEPDNFTSVMLSGSYSF